MDLTLLATRVESKMICFGVVLEGVTRTLQMHRGVHNNVTTQRRDSSVQHKGQASKESCATLLALNFVGSQAAHNLGHAFLGSGLRFWISRSQKPDE